MNRQILVALFLFFSIYSFGDEQEKIDSLHLVLNNSQGNERVDILNELSSLSRNEELKEAGRYAQIAIDVAKEEGYEEGRAIGFTNLAKYFSRLSKGDSAEYAYLNALEYYEKTNKIEQTASLYNALGITLMNAGQYSESLDYLTKGMVLRQQIGDNIQIGGSYCNMGIVMEYLREPEQALEYYMKAYEYLKDGENQQYLSNVLMNIGVVYFTMEDYRKASDYYSQAMVIQIQNDDQYGLMSIYMNLGNLNMEMGDMNAAIVYHNMSLSIANQMDDKNSISGTYINLGDLYANEMGVFDKGIEYLEKGLALSKVVGNKEWESNAYSSLAEAYAGKKKFEQAYQYEKQFATLNDSLVRANAKLQMKKTKALVEIQKARLIQNERKLAESSQKESSFSNRLMIIVGCASVLVLILLLLYLKQRKHL